MIAVLFNNEMMKKYYMKDEVCSNCETELKENEMLFRGYRCIAVVVIYL